MHEHRRSLRKPLFFALATGALALIVASGSLAAVPLSDDTAFLAGLRRRGLFESAALLCRNQLAEVDLSASDRADWTAELLITLTQQAINAPRGEREPIWSEAADVVDRFEGQEPQHPRLALVLYHGGLSRLAHGELAREEAALAGSPQAGVEEALAALRESIALFEGADTAIAEARRRRSGPSAPRPSGGELSDRELLSLERNTKRQRARASRNVALCYPAASPDRSLALAEALGHVEPLAALEIDDPLIWDARLEALTCYRLQKDHDRVREILEGLASIDTSPSVASRLETERIRLAVDQGRTEEAATLAEKALEARSPPADLRLAALEAIVVAWNAAEAAGDAENAALRQRQALALRRRLEAECSPYWRRRAQILLAQKGGQNLDLLIDVAEDAFSTGRFDEALDAYDEAVQAARAAGHAAKAFGLMQTAAGVEQQCGNVDAALARYRRAALTYPKEPEAAATHRMAVWLAGKAARTDDETALALYAELLREHLSTWPDDPQTDDLLWRLGLVCEHRGDLPQALRAYRRTDRDFAGQGQVVDAVERCTVQLLEDTPRAATAQPDRAAELQASLQWLESLIPPKNAPGEAWGPTARMAVLAAARLMLQHEPDSHREVSDLLLRAIRAPQEASPEWSVSARLLLIVALAGAGDVPRAEEELAAADTGRPDALVSMLEELSRLTRSAQGARRIELANLQLRWIAEIRSRVPEMTNAQQRRVRKREAEAYAAAGDLPKALAAYASLAADHPRDRDIQTEYARLLSSRPDRAAREAALERWRLVESGSEPDSDAWFEAKYEIALLHYRLGNADLAARMIALLMVTRPELGGPERKRKFLDLLEACRIDSP